MAEETTIEAPAPAAPPAPAPVAEAPAETKAETTEGEKPAEGEKPEGEKKAEKPWYEKELQKKQRRIDNLTRRLYQTQDLPREPIDGTNRSQQDDSEPLSLSGAEFQRLPM